MSTPFLAMLVHFHLGHAYAGMNRRDAARKEYRQFLFSFETSKEALPELEQARAAPARLR